MMKSYTHVYGVTNCPKCRADLSQKDTVHLFASVAGNIISVPTRLTATGELVDVDNLIKNGYHSSTECACYHPLNEYEVVFDPNLGTMEEDVFTILVTLAEREAGYADSAKQEVLHKALVWLQTQMDLERTKGDQL